MVSTRIDVIETNLLMEFAIAGCKVVVSFAEASTIENIDLRSRPCY
jgi:hypothetical protein